MAFFKLVAKVKRDGSVPDSHLSEVLHVLIFLKSIATLHRFDSIATSSPNFRRARAHVEAIRFYWLVIGHLTIARAWRAAAGQGSRCDSG